VDALDVVSEAHESNSYRTSFTMCWPADLVASSTLMIHPHPLREVNFSTIQAEWGEEEPVCVYPEYVLEEAAEGPFPPPLCFVAPSVAKPAQLLSSVRQPQASRVVSHVGLADWRGARC